MAVLRHELNAEPDTQSDEEQRERHACTPCSLSLAIFVLHLPFEPACGVDIFYRRREWNTHVSTVTETPKGYCSIVHTGGEPVACCVTLFSVFLTAALSRLPHQIRVSRLSCVSSEHSARACYQSHSHHEMQESA